MHLQFGVFGRLGMEAACFENLVYILGAFMIIADDGRELFKLRKDGHGRIRTDRFQE